MSVLNVLLLTVVVGLSSGQKLSIDTPTFRGFIESRDAEAFLFYRQDDVHGEMPVSSIQRIDFSYKRGQPFPLTVTLRDGRKLVVQSERRDFVIVKGQSEGNLLTIQHPDPLSSPLKLSTRKPDRKNDLTIEYLEFPAN